MSKTDPSIELKQDIQSCTDAIAVLKKIRADYDSSEIVDLRQIASNNQYSIIEKPSKPGELCSTYLLTDQTCDNCPINKEGFNCNSLDSNIFIYGDELTKDEQNLELLESNIFSFLTQLLRLKNDIYKYV